MARRRTKRFNNGDMDNSGSPEIQDDDSNLTVKKHSKNRQPSETKHISNDIVQEILKFVEEGQPISEIAKRTGMDEAVIHSNLSFWVANTESNEVSRFKVRAAASLRPDDVALDDIHKSTPLLEKGDVDGFITKMAPHVVRKMTELALFSNDVRIASDNCKALAHMAGYKPVDRVDVYAKVERLSREELLAQIQSAFTDNKELARALIGATVQIPMEAKTGRSGMADDAIECQEGEYMVVNEGSKGQVN